MKPKLIVFKIGGNVIDDKVALTQFLKEFSLLTSPKILVHGGGKLATRLCEKLGIETKMVSGRRITSAESLEVITMVYAGLANKNIVAQLQSNGCNAVGLTGADMNTITAVKRPVTEIDYGWVGDIEKVNAVAIKQLLDTKNTAVFCALTHDGKGQLLNTNADTIASEIAIAMSKNFETELHYCFEKKGVLQSIEDENSVISAINPIQYQDLKANKIINEGMLPKMENAFHALENGVSKVMIRSHQLNENNFTTLSL